MKDSQIKKQKKALRFKLVLLVAVSLLIIVNVVYYAYSFRKIFSIDIETNQYFTEFKIKGVNKVMPALALEYLPQTDIVLEAKNADGQLVEVDKDEFEVFLLPELISNRFSRVIFKSENFNYDSKNDAATNTLMSMVRAKRIGFLDAFKEKVTEDEIPSKSTFLERVQALIKDSKTDDVWALLTESKDELDYPEALDAYLDTLSEGSPHIGNSITIKDQKKYFEAALEAARVSPFKVSSFELVNAYLYGIGTEASSQKAFDVAKNASFLRPRFLDDNCGFLHSLAYLAYAYENGMGVAKNSKKAALYWKRFYKSLDSKSEDEKKSNLSHAYYVLSGFANGKNFPKDPAKALEILKNCYAKINLENCDHIDPHLLNLYSFAFKQIYSGYLDQKLSDDEALKKINAQIKLAKKKTSDCE